MTMKPSERHGFGMEALSLFKVVRNVCQLDEVIEGGDQDGLGIEYLADLITYQIVDGLHIQLGRQRPLYVVNEGEFSIPLASLFNRAGTCQCSGNMLGHEFKDFDIFKLVTNTFYIALNQYDADGLRLDLEWHSNTLIRLRANLFKLTAFHCCLTATVCV